MLYKGLLHSHVFFTTLFFVHYVIKLALLQTDKKDALTKYTKVTKVPEMILSAGFLVTGVWLLFSGSIFTMYIAIKLVCVAAAIPLAVIGFKRNNKALAMLSVLLIAAAYGLAETNKKHKTGGAVDTTTVASNPMEVGKTVYDHSCVTCHGADGKLGLNGAKDLSVSQLNDDDKKTLIRNGKNSMPPYSKDVLTDEQLDAVVLYIGTLKQ